MLRDIESWISGARRGRALAEAYTARVDGLVRRVFSEAGEESGMALLAVGGYGRGELAPFSDVDIMFLARDRSRPEAAERTLYALWDSGLEISHSFRTPEECVEEAFRDIRTRTSLLEMRYAAGNREIFDLFRRDVYPVIAYRKQKEFVRRKLQEMEQRHARSGDTVLLLEPHIKEGEGCLRDIHTVYWLAKVALKLENLNDLARLLGPREHERFLRAYDFLITMRFCLHLESGRRNDVLSFEHQKGMAWRLGFRDSGKFTAAERMMRYYYLKSGIVKEATRKMAALCTSQYAPVVRDWKVRRLTEDFSVAGGKLIATSESVFGGNAEKLLECFSLYAATGKPFSEMLRERIRANVFRMSKKTRSSPVAVRHFLDVVRGDRVYATLLEMHQTRVLGWFLPEFGALRSLVVHEPYHVYTVDEHTLHAVKSLEDLRTTKYRHLEEMRRIFGEMDHREILFLAILFHDIGKAAGRRHEEEGYKRLKGILERFHLEPQKRGKIEFLVKNHVRMARVALTREASDPDEVARFADLVGDVENLKSLYLITYADMSAVSPSFWTSWKAYLLRELFVNTLNHLTGVAQEGHDYPGGYEGCLSDAEIKAFGDFIDEMPERYRISTSKRRRVEDFLLARVAREQGFGLRIDRQADGMAELTICGDDSPGLFSRIVGFLASRGLNIIEGRIFTGSRGLVVDKVTVSNWEHLWWKGLDAEVAQGLKEVISGRMPARVPSGRCPSGSPYDSFIELDNEATDEFSILEIFCHDRLGLLHDIAAVMQRHGVEIVSARFHTGAGLAQDVFYVHSRREKLDNRGAQELLSDLWAILEG